MQQGKFLRVFRSRMPIRQLPSCRLRSLPVRHAPDPGLHSVSCCAVQARFQPPFGGVPGFPVTHPGLGCTGIIPAAKAQVGFGITPNSQGSPDWNQGPSRAKLDPIRVQFSLTNLGPKNQWAATGQLKQCKNPMQPNKMQLTLPPTKHHHGARPHSIPT
jgi:hypothetical protein